MKQAIILMIHSFKKNVINILKEMDYEGFDFYIHIDKTSKLNKSDFENVCKKSNVYIYKQISVHWGGTSQLKCELFMFDKVKSTKIPYSYIHLLSGEDYPLVTNKVLFDFFDKSNKEYVDYELLPLKEEYKLKYYFLAPYFTKRRKIITGCNKIFLPIQKFLHINRKHKLINCKSAQWVSITFNASLYLLEKKKEILKYYKFTYCPDEFFIATFLYNSPFKDNIVQDSTRLIDWTRGGPYLFTEADAEQINNSDKLIARKINIEKNNLPKMIKRREQI